MKNKNQFYAWVTFQRRAVSMQPYFSYDLKFISTSIKKKWLKPLDYIIKGIRTGCLLLKNKPQILWIQLPPTPLMYIVLLYKKIHRKSIVIVDCHNGALWGKWKKYLDTNKLNRCDIIIVHNRVIRDIASNLGIDSKKLIILEDKPTAKNQNNKHICSLKTERPQILMPCSFNVDEPLDIVFEAARQIPDVDILISGDAKRGASLFDYSKKPDNVNLLGYLPQDDYETVFIQSDLILALTTEDHIQLSVANEAVGFEVPMVISDTKLLQELFNKGAIYVETLNASSIAKGITTALQTIDILKIEIKELKIERNQRWENMAETLKRRINYITSCSQILQKS
jgi:glycosyltransferase involved in cell wall biosynthesis